MKNYIVILLLMAECAFASEVPTEVKNAISEALKGKWAFQFYEINKKIWGFDSTTKLSDIKAGDPFQIYTMSRDKFENADENTPVCSLITPGDWMVPLYVNGESMQTLLLISNHFGEKEKWSAGVRSAKGFAQSWEQIRKAWPERLGYHPKFIWILHPMMYSACFFVPEKGDTNLTVFGTYYLGFSQKPVTTFSNLFSSRETLRSLRSVWEEHERKSESSWKVQEKIGDSLVKIQETKTESLWKEREMRDNESASGKGGPIPASAVTSWWMNMLIRADSAIIPAHYSRKKPDTLQLKQTNQSDRNSRLEMRKDSVILDSQIIKTALPLKVGARPIDQIVTSGQNQWYVLHAEGGIGFIRIGATGPILIDDALFKEGQAWGPGGSYASYEGPKSGADLTEILWLVKTAYLRIRTTSIAPVSYRISFVSELPENRTGCAYGPGVAAQSYIMAVANGNTTDLYRTTRTHYASEQATELREKLFKTKDRISSFSVHRRPDALEPNAEDKLHVQHIILSAKKSTIERRHWAFVIICEQRDGLWLVVNASRDPDLSDSQVAEIVERDFHNQHVEKK